MGTKTTNKHLLAIFSSHPLVVCCCSTQKDFLFLGGTCCCFAECAIFTFFTFSSLIQPHAILMERIHKFILPPGVGWAIRESRICLFLGRVFTVLAVIMCAIWCMKKNVEDDKYLGGIEFYDHDKIFNLHPICMILSMLLCVGLSMTSFRDGWSFKVSKNMHLAFNLLAKIFMIVGLRSAYIYRDEPQGKHSAYHYQHFSTMHSWMGLTTSFLLFQQDVLGGINYLYPKFCRVPRYVIKAYKEYHGTMGKVSFAMAGVAMVTGM